MIQFNLLPDVKIAYIKAQRQKQLVVSISVIASIAAITVFLLLFMFVNVAQKKNMNDLTKDIKTQNADLMETKDLDKILTIQNQIGALDGLHSQKVVANRLFDYLQQVTPADVSITQLDVDFAANTISVTGKTQKIAAINTYTDSLKFTKFSTKNDETEKQAFKDVVLASLTRTDGKNDYTITTTFDPLIFAQEEEVKLKVPQMLTTRSSTERPGALFEENTSGGQ